MQQSDILGMRFLELRATATRHAAWRSYAREHNLGANGTRVNRSQLVKFALSHMIEGGVHTAGKWIIAKFPGADCDGKTFKVGDRILYDFNAKVVLDCLAADGSSPPADRDMIEEIVNDMLSVGIEDAVNSAIETKADLAKLAAEAVREAIAGSVLRIEVKHADGTVHNVAGLQHPMFADLLKVCSVRLPNGHHPNVWLVGPTGSGKTHAARQVADALGRKFAFHGSMTMAHELIGYEDAAGRYHETLFVQAYRNGWVCLLDEIDAGDNAAILAINAALANSHIALPSGEIVERHPDFLCIGAANTVGLGATADYVGRSKIDAAILSRFAITIAWGYDDAFEQQIAGNAGWAKRVQQARARAQAAGLKVVIDPRHSMAGAALIANGVSEKQAAELTYLARLTADQRRIVEA